MNRDVKLDEIEGATIRMSLAEILSGPVALFMSRVRSFFNTVFSRTLKNLNFDNTGVSRQISCLGANDFKAEAKWSAKHLAMFAAPEITFPLKPDN